MKLLIAVILMALNGFAELVASPHTVRTFALGNAFGYAVVGPALIGLLFCIPERHRHLSRFLNVFMVVTVFLLVGTLPRIVRSREKGGLMSQADDSPPQVIQGRFAPIQVTVPSTWKRATPEKAEWLINVSDATGAVGVRVSVLSNPTIDMARHRERTLDTLKKNASYRSMRGPFACNMPRLSCHYHEVSLALAEGDATSLVAFIETRDNFYNFIGASSTPHYVRNKAQLLSILASFREVQP